MKNVEKTGKKKYKMMNEYEIGTSYCFITTLIGTVGWIIAGRVGRLLLRMLSITSMQPSLVSVVPSWGAM